MHIYRPDIALAIIEGIKIESTHTNDIASNLTHSKNNKNRNSNSNSINNSNNYFPINRAESVQVTVFILFTVHTKIFISDIILQYNFMQHMNNLLLHMYNNFFRCFQTFLKAHF